ncbi:stage II sporulation protein P [Alkalihalobacillus sp. 1P02AB]|uniref:stage II sporulation protein P n=1 Tax=Alkalihalobacillus sp. 1P02AB TaxID=3132260 RepID=UPI0039A61E27
MRRRQSYFLMGAKKRTSFKNIFITIFLGVFIIFLLTGLLTSIDKKPSSVTFYQWSSEVSGEDFLYFMGLENHYFKMNLPSGYQGLNVGETIFNTVTSISLDDPRSFLGRELPGMSHYQGEMYISSEGAEHTDFLAESAPPLEIILAEREATKESLAKLEELEKEKQAQANKNTNGQQVVYIINAHNHESYLPELETTVPNEAYHSQVNVTLVSDKLAIELEKHGIGVLVEERDVQGMLKERGWSYNQSYTGAREFITETLETKDAVEFVFDLHRDSLPRERTTVNINGVDYAKALFVIGGNHDDYGRSLQLAEELVGILEEHYPGLGRVAPLKTGTRTNGVFNQDLNTNSLLIEMGGYENSLEEAYRTAEVIAKVFAEYYFEHYHND